MYTITNSSHAVKILRFRNLSLDNYIHQLLSIAEKEGYSDACRDMEALLYKEQRRGSEVYMHKANNNKNKYYDKLSSISNSINIDLQEREEYDSEARKEN